MTKKEFELVVNALGSIQSSISEWKFYLSEDYISDSEGINSALQAAEYLRKALGKDKKKSNGKK